MGKKGGSRKTPNSIPQLRNPITLRDDATGKKQNKGAVNVKSRLKHEHLQNLASWASSEASIPSLAAFFGNRLAADAEISSIPPDPSLFSCQRCETILQPGFNCTVRVEKNRAKSRNRRRKPHTLTQNNVVFNCHFCSHRNLKRGTPKGHMKEICPSKLRTPSVSKKSVSIKKDAAVEDKEEPCKVEDAIISSPTIAVEAIPVDDPATPMVRTGRTLDVNKRKRSKSGSKIPAESEASSAATNAGKIADVSAKKKRKTWMSLKEMAVSNKKSNTRNITTTAVPFLL